MCLLIDASVRGEHLLSHLLYLVFAISSGSFAVFVCVRVCERERMHQNIFPLEWYNHLCINQ